MHVPRSLAAFALAEVGRSFDTEKTAWDIYLFYPPGVRWDDHLPAPAAGLVQMKGAVYALPAKTEVGPQDDFAGDLARTSAAFTNALRAGSGS